MAPGSSSEPFQPGGGGKDEQRLQLLKALLAEDGPEDDVGAWGCVTAKFAARCDQLRSKVESTEEEELWRIDSCPKGHRLKPWITPGGICNGCKRDTPQGARVLDCRECDWYLCCRCQPQPQDQDDKDAKRPDVADIFTFDNQINAPPVCNTFLFAIPVIAACLAFVSHCEGWPPLADGLLFPGMAPPAHYPTVYVVGTEGQVMWGPRLGGRELLERERRHVVDDEAYLSDPIFPGCGLAARKHVLHDEVSDMHFSTLMDVPVDGAGLACHDWHRPVKVPCGWELVSDSGYVASNIVAAHNWSTHVVVLGSGNGYGTAGFQPGVPAHRPGSRWTWESGLGGDAESGYYANYCMHQVLIQHIREGEDSRLSAEETEQERPVIFDVGASLGVSMVHFASRIPRARIFAFEPAPQVFELLQRNMAGVKMRYRRHGAERGGSCAGSVLYGGPVSSQGQCQLMCSHRESCNFYVFWDKFLSGNARTGRPWCRLTTSCESRSRELNPRNIGTAYKKEAPEPADAASAVVYRTALGEDESRSLTLRYWKKSAGVSLPVQDSWPVAEDEYEDFTCNITTVSSVIESHGLQRIDLLKVTSALGGLDVLRGVQEHHWPLVKQLVVEVGSLAADVLSFLRRRDFEAKQQTSPSGDVLVYAIRR